MRKLNILIVSENASDAFGGEAILPLNYFRFLQKTTNNVYLITHERVRPTIEEVSGIDQNQVFYVPDTWIHKALHQYFNWLPERIKVVTVGFLMHLVTQFYQRKLAKKIIKDKQIDIVHEPAPVSATQPSAMFGLGVPVIIGPMNGGMSFPPAFQHMAGKVESTLYYLMRFFTDLYNVLIPGKLFAKVLLVANQRTKSALPKFRCGKVIELVENGVFSVLPKPKPVAVHRLVNVIYIGRLVDWKKVDIAIEAIAKCKEHVKLTIVGDGPLKHELIMLAEKIAPNKVEFLGLLPHEKINQTIDAADISILTSVRECGGAVVLEAMSRGLPVIATDWGGPADYISSESGFLVAPTSHAYMVDTFSAHIDTLASQSELRHKIGKAALLRIKQHFLWGDKVKNIINVYRGVLETESTKA